MNADCKASLPTTSLQYTASAGYVALQFAEVFSDFTRYLQAMCGREEPARRFSLVGNTSLFGMHMQGPKERFEAANHILSRGHRSPHSKVRDLVTCPSAP